MDRIAYRNLRDEVYTTLKNYIYEEEARQKNLKRNKACLYGYYRNNEVVELPSLSAFYAKESAKQAKKLTKLYEIIRFLKYGLRLDTAFAEDDFNEIFAKHKNFRNKFWTFWNAKFNKEQEK